MGKGIVKRKGFELIDVIFEVRKMETERLSNGKETEVYKNLHKKAVEMIQYLNNTKYPGYISISKARSLIYFKEKNASLKEFLDVK